MRLFMIFFALVVAVAAGVGFWLVTSKPEATDKNTIVAVAPPQQVAVQEQTILVARRDIPVGQKLTEEDIDRQVWPQHLVHPDFIVSGDEGKVIDMVARTAFKERQPLAMSFLANPNDPGFLAAQLPAGRRAITIPVDAITGLNGFIFPGDRVDVLVKHQVGLNKDYADSNDVSATEEETGIKGKPVSVMRLPLENTYQVPLLMTPSKYSGRPVIGITEVLISNARVLAVGKASAQYENANNPPTNVTLEVTELDAQKIRHADEGTLSLALRALDDSEDKSVPRPIADADMSRLTPPSYFPYAYDNAEYKTQGVALEDIDYSAPEAQKETKKPIAVIRGVKKEIVGVNHP